MMVLCRKRHIETIKTSSLGGVKEGSTTTVSKEFLKYDTTGQNPEWKPVTNGQLAVARFDHAAGVITKELADQLCP